MVHPIVQGNNFPGHNQAVHLINQTLKGPVTDILRNIVPDFAALNRDDLYDIVMDRSDLLHTCIGIFRLKREKFSTLLVDERGRPVEDDRVRLRCGRSLQDILSMIVRTHAKRHFRSILGGDPNNPASRSGRLYMAIREYLLHDWQVPLVPHYAPLPVEVVLRLGPALLTLRDAASLQALLPSVPALPPPAPVLSSGASSAARPAETPVVAEVIPVPPPPTRPAVTPPPIRPPSTPQEEFWWEALSDRQATQVLGSRTATEMRELVAALAGINEAVRSEMFGPLSLSTVQAATSLATAYRTLGHHGFAKVFGQPGTPSMVATIARRLRERGVGSHTDLTTLSRLTEAAVRR